MHTVNEIIAELLNNGHVILYDTCLLDELIKELDSRNIDYSYKNYVDYYFFTLN
ncbi:hypothetical protein [Ureibacillus chungkukjangi]|uniref:hypothetical protein n=1 Tax=Ureibacillus chungkukjangi TaxID=1202712 RepID=UPI0020418E46|nr:hypothetical protein [Ureibacillus chungkukjangi]